MTSDTHRVSSKPRTRRRLWLCVGIAGALAIALFLRTFGPSPLPAPKPLAAAVPAATPPRDMAVFQLPTGITRRTAAFAHRGGSLTERRDFVMTAVLVRHPRGDLLIDAGFGRHVDRHFQKMPLYFRMATPYARTLAAAEQLAAAGYDMKQLRAIVLTHAHWDHVSGVEDFPSVPVWVTAEEQAFIAQGGALTAVARSLRGVRYERYGFADGPYLGFPASYDVYDDGSVVIVPAPGHTPGSVIVFVSLANGSRYALVGDLVWQREGILQREERAWPMRRLADWDEGGVRESLLRMSAIAARFPELTLVPAHDARGFASMPKLPPARAIDAPKP